MNRCRIIQFAITILLIPNTGVLADIAPDPMTAGKALQEFDGEATEVRMVSEDVLVRVFESEIITVAEFFMYNEGETDTMEVGFPYAYEGEYIEFRAFVNGLEVDTRDGKKEHVGRKKMTVFWKLWEMTFEKGEFVALNGKTDSAEMNIELLNDLASAFAIGRDIHVGDTIVGIKGRVGFEAAAALIIIKAHHLLEKHTLTKWQLQHKDYLSNFYGMHLHEGQYLDPVMRDMEAFLQNSQAKVSGDVTVSLKPYHFSLDGITSKHDLMNAKFGSYGEENTGWSAEEAKGFIKILGNQNKIYQQVNSEL